MHVAARPCRRATGEVYAQLVERESRYVSHCPDPSAATVSSLSCTWWSWKATCFVKGSGHFPRSQPHPLSAPGREEWFWRQLYRR
jgi:hypothetical protein